MFWAKPGEYEPCGIFSQGHIVLLIITSILIVLALIFTKSSNEKKVKNIIRICSILLWVLEVIKITFNLIIGNGVNPNNYLPLYYCSIILYAGLLSGFAKGFLKRIGDVFIATGAIIGGIFFLVCPTTSLPAYPMLHYISIQSFIFHGTMIYLGLLVNISNYIDLKISDIKFYGVITTIMCVISYIVNKILKTNFMFISDNFPNTPIEILYNITGKFFTIFMILIQVIGPFYVVYGIQKLIRNIHHEIHKKEICY